MIRDTFLAMLFPGVVAIISAIVAYYGWTTGDRAAVFAAGLLCIYIVWHTTVIQQAIQSETTAKTTKISRQNYESDISKNSNYATPGVEKPDDTVEFVTE